MLVASASVDDPGCVKKEISGSGPQSVRLDVGRPDHLTPFFGFVGDECAKISGRAGKDGVRFPPGRLRLATRPESIGSVPIEKTTGILSVAAFAANAATADTTTITPHLTADQIGDRRELRPIWRPSFSRCWERSIWCTCLIEATANLVGDGEQSRRDGEVEYPKR
jgi:hypothetical protein